jgi:hypothetical protein
MFLYKRSEDNFKAEMIFAEKLIFNFFQLWNLLSYRPLPPPVRKRVNPLVVLHFFPPMLLKVPQYAGRSPEKNSTFLFFISVKNNKYIGIQFCGNFVTITDNKIYINLFLILCDHNEGMFLAKSTVS